MTNLSWTTQPWALYEPIYAARDKPINPPGKVAPSSVIKLGYLIMADTEEQSLDRHHPNVAPDRDSGTRSSIQLRQQAILSIGHVRLTRHTEGKADLRCKRERNRLFNQNLFLTISILFGH
jgi:hypothetical protein